MGEPITITITADEDDLRRMIETSGPNGRGFRWVTANRIAAAIAAALPAPRVHPQPGDLLRRRSDGLVCLSVHSDLLSAAGHLSAANADDAGCWGWSIPDGLDPAEWDIIRAADIPWPARAS